MHNALEYGKKSNPEYFISVSGCENKSICERPGLHRFASYNDIGKSVLVKCLDMRRVRIETYYVFVGHEYVHHYEMRWDSEHAMLHCTYKVSKGYDLKRAVPLTYGDSLGRMEQMTIRYLNL